VNNFATIILEDQFIYDKVKFYSVAFENEVSEVNKFFEKMEDAAAVEDAVRFIAFIEEIGNSRGAKQRYFRKEKDFEALPPKNKEVKELELQELESIENWRLYCLRLSDSIVILFNGGIKTANKAQDCPNVSPFFYQAARFTKLIDEAIREGDISILPNQLKINPNFELML